MYNCISSIRNHLPFIFTVLVLKLVEAWRVSAIQ